MYNNLCIFPYILSKDTNLVRVLHTLPFNRRFIHSFSPHSPDRFGKSRTIPSKSDAVSVLTVLVFTDKPENNDTLEGSLLVDEQDEETAGKDDVVFKLLLLDILSSCLTG